MGHIKNFFKEFWITPFPRFFVEKFSLLFRWIKLPSKPLTTTNFLLRSGILSIVALVALVILSGTFNPLDLLFEIPYLSADQYLASISNYNNFTWTEYLVFSSMLITIILWFIHTFVFHKEEVKFLSVKGLMYALMTVLVAMLVDYLFQDVFRVFHETYLTDTSKDLPSLLTALAANFGIFFMLQDAFSTHLSFSLTPFICKLLKLDVFGLGLVQFMVVSTILKMILTLLEKIGIWQIIIRFIEKWIYTPKYMFLIVASCYLFVIIIAVRLNFPDFYKKVKDKYLAQE